MQSLTCPRCQLPLADVDLSATVSIGCTKCGGSFVWLNELPGDGAQAKRAGWLSRQLVPMLRESRHYKELPCARCRQAMQPLRVVANQEFVVDRCLACHALWLDQGEGAKLLAMCAEHGRVTDAPAPQGQPPDWVGGAQTAASALARLTAVPIAVECLLDILIDDNR